MSSQQFRGKTETHRPSFNTTITPLTGIQPDVSLERPGFGATAVLCLKGRNMSRSKTITTGYALYIGIADLSSPVMKNRVVRHVVQVSERTKAVPSAKQMVTGCKYANSIQNSAGYLR